MYRGASEAAHNMKVGFRCLGINILLFPMGTGIVKTVPALGRAKIIGNQATGYQPVYGEISQGYSSLKLFTNEFIIIIHI
jgi:hypothetical protein